MKVQDRPYAGNWSLDFQNKYRVTRSWTPDAIVTFNGESTLPGCPTCKNRIDFSRFISSVSASGGIDGSNGCDISLKIPWSYGDSVYKDGQFILTTGIEVFVYYRGFFKVDELALKVDNIELNNGEVLEANKVETRPYYPVFHGVISQVSVSVEDGSYSVSISTRNMLSFWDNQQINTQQGYFAADPTMSRGSINLKGHVYTNMTPHQIIYDLFLDSGGAAEGTGFALRKTSNVNASASTGQQFYSLYIKYLQERFASGSMYGLRMYGASGRMYSALAEQIFSNTKPTKKGKDTEFRKVIKEQNKPYTVQKSKGATFSRLVKAGIIAYETGEVAEGRIQRTLDARTLTQASEKDTVGVSILSQKAFVPDLGNFGQVNFFESTLQSKKSIADEVCRVTGYEFYQDMDGDLVFKPPMYNMDTSADRVYNIFREDIISISYNHEEPQATYVVCKGNHFRNLQGHGIDNEWGIKGVYVDYALVAKYGWRAHEFDSSFYNSPRQAYYAAAVELEKMNKGTEGCSVQIPLRPEIKPGYPVYIEENDCFYYIESIQHSFSFGSSCTTDLTLVAQRKKFIPPGDYNFKYSTDPDKAVDLERTELPQRFIYRNYDRGGEALVNAQSADAKITYKKITGFPNVVMALDPNNVNPNMFLYEPEYQNLGNFGTKERKRYLKGLVSEALRLKVLKPQAGGTTDNGPWELLSFKDGKIISTPVGVEQGDVQKVITYKTKKGITKPRTISRGKKIKTRKVKKFNQDQVDFFQIAGINALDVITTQIRLEGQNAAKAAGKARTAGRAPSQTQTNEEALRRIRESVGEGNLGEGGQATILDILNAVKSARGKGEFDSPLQNLIALLSDRKASFAPKAQGYFRYYSSSHPSPQHQGPDITSYNIDPEKETPTLIFDEVAPDTAKSNIVIADPSDPAGDTVKFDDNRNRITRGLLTRTMYSRGVEYVPTKDIKSLSFQISSEFTVNKVPGPKINMGYFFDEPLVEFWAPALEKLHTIIKNSKNFRRANATMGLVVNKLYKVALPDDYDFGRRGISISPEWTSTPTTEWKTTDAFSIGLKFFDGNSKEKLKDLKNIVSDAKRKSVRDRLLAESILYPIFKYTLNKYPDLYEEVQDAGDLSLNLELDVEKHERVTELVSEVNQIMIYTLVPFETHEVERFGVEVKNKKYRTTPIFPISDENGYEVFGAYQYGRSLRVARGTVFDAILKQDGLRIFTAEELKKILDELDKSRDNAEFQSRLKQKYIEKLRTLQEKDPQIVERIAIGLGLSSEDIDYAEITSDNPLVNRLMTGGDEQIVSNVPTALAEIYPDTEGNESCHCRLHSTDVVLLQDSLDLSNFVDIENPLLRGVKNETVRKSYDWIEHQKALRGENIDRGGDFVETTGFGEGFKLTRGSTIQENRLTGAAFDFVEAFENTDSNFDNLSDQAKQIIAQSKRIDDPFTEES